MTLRVLVVLVVLAALVLVGRAVGRTPSRRRGAAAGSGIWTGHAAWPGSGSSAWSDGGGGWGDGGGGGGGDGGGGGC